MSTFSNNVGEYKVTFSSINTDASEYSPMYYKDGLLFISNRQQKNRYAFQWDRTSYSDMYIVDKLEAITVGEPDSVNNQPAAAPYLLRGKVRSSYHEGPAVLLPEGSLLFTRNNIPQAAQTGKLLPVFPTTTMTIQQAIQQFHRTERY